MLDSLHVYSLDETMNASASIYARSVCLLGLAFTLGGAASANGLSQAAQTILDPVSTRAFAQAGTTQFRVGSVPIVLPVPESFTDIGKELPDFFASLQALSPTQNLGGYFMDLGVGSVEDLVERSTRAPYIMIGYTKGMPDVAVSPRGFDEARRHMSIAVEKLPKLMESPEFQNSLNRMSKGLGYDSAVLSRPVSLGIHESKGDRFIFSQIATLATNEGSVDSTRTMIRTGGAILVRGRVLNIFAFRNYAGDVSIDVNRKFVMDYVEGIKRLNP